MSKGGGSSGGGAGTQTAQSTNAPWGPTQTYIKGGLSDLGKWYSSDYGRNPYPGSSVVPFNPMTEQALGRTAQRAMNGSPLTTEGQNQTLKTARGDYLSPDTNPFLSGVYDTAAGKVRSSLDSQFNNAGGYGGSLHQGAMSSNLSDLANNLYGGQYQNERSNQMSAIQNSPGMAQQDYFDMGQLANAGNAYENQAGNYVKDAMNRWDFAQNAPYQRLQQFFNVATPQAGLGGTQSQTQNQGTSSNGSSGTLGTVLTVASIAASLF